VVSLIPIVEIGVLNVWIVVLYSALTVFITNIIFNKDNLKVEGPKSQTEKKYRRPWFILFVLFAIYSIFLPFKLGTVWFYVGLPICLVGLVLLTITQVNMATTPLRNKCVTKGLYRYSRHPMYITMFLMLIGAGIASASWVPIVFGVISMILWVPLSISEERHCLETYGDSYQKYMKKTPRWIGIPKD
jgi:protein-S-isoprenylcysteine O-methyltransferase Ste14